MVASVAITAIECPRARKTACFAPGSTTPMTGMGSAASRSFRATALAVLHATTIIFGSNLRRKSQISCENRVIV